MAIEVQAWQLVGLAVTVLTTLFAVYGSIIYANDDRIETNHVNHKELHGRLYGEDRGESGDINNIKEAVDGIDTKQDELCDRTEANAEALTRIEATTHFIVDKLVEEDINGDFDAVNQYYDRLDDRDGGERAD